MNELSNSFYYLDTVDFEREMDLLKQNHGFDSDFVKKIEG